MALINAASGRAKVGSNTIGQLKNISIDRTEDTGQVHDSSVNQAPRTRSGNVDWSGTFEVNGADPIVVPGETVTIEADAGNGEGWSGDCIIDEVTLTVNLESAEEISYSVSFSGNGALTYGDVTVSVDAVDTVLLNSKDAVLSIAAPAGSPSYSEIPNWKQVTITLTADNIQYTDASTNGVVKRLAGNKDCSLSVDMNIDGADIGAAAVPQVGDKYMLTLTIGGITWTINYVRINGHSGISISPMERNVIAATLDCSWDAIATIDATDTEGNITAGSKVFHAAA